MVYTELQIEEMKQEFIRLLRSTNRAGIEELIAWLDSDNCDFFYAPSSTVYHNCCKGGLLAHSLNVYKAALLIRDNMKVLALPEKHVEEITDDSIIISCLLHDLCKTKFYQETVKLFKDETAPYGQQWKKYMAYEINDKLPLGHGEKSVIIAQQFIRLTIPELAAIRWHMSFSDVGVMMSSYSRPAFMRAINDMPLVMVVAQADQFASFMMEKEIDLKTEQQII